jgi:recombination protein RecT
MSNNLTSWKSTLKEAHTKFVAINPEKAQSELGFAMQIFQNSDTLQRCDPQSILNAVVNVARTSVTLNPVMRLAYLVPRKNKCVLDFSYMGLVAMLRDNNCIKSISAHIVYEDEEFDYDVAYNKITHKPRFAKTENEHKSRERIGCYSRATIPNGEIVFEFMPMWEIEKVKRLSEGSSSKFSAWQTWEEEMIKKVVIKRHFKMLISGNPSEALSTALQIENENNALIGSFDGKSAVGAKKKPSLMSAFDEEQEEQLPPTQLFIMDEGNEQVVTTSRDGTIKVEHINKPIDTSMDLSEEEIEAMLEEEAKKAHKNFTEPSTNLSEPIELFPSEDEEQENNDNMGWFPTPKGE